MKGLGPRAYNILFHTHTVSGIVISTALFVIFFAGAFTLFKEEFYLWENPSVRHRENPTFHLSEVLDVAIRENPKLDLDDDLFITIPSEASPLVNVYGHLEPGKDGKEIHVNFKLDPQTSEVLREAPSTVGETLYRLHFLDQLPYLGRWLAGFVSLFFVFATFTGVLIHWKNLLGKFWAFSFKGSWKQIWTNAHTVLGLMGLPFQLMYAVTGAFYLLLLLVLLPAVLFFYEGKPEKVYAMVYPYMGITYDENAPEASNFGKIEPIYRLVNQKYGQQNRITAINTRHVGKVDGTVNFRLRSSDPGHLISTGYVGYRLSDGKELYRSMPGPDKTYAHSVVEAMGHLHFASFGGLLIKVFYFLMALFTCFVIISGILLWKQARNNRNYTEKQRRFHHRVTMVYLAICVGLFPAVAYLFNAELWLGGGDRHKLWVEGSFFVVWLGLILAGLFFKTERSQTRFYLSIAGVLSILVPVTNGWLTSDWIWSTFQKGQTALFATDLFWLITGVLCFFIVGNNSVPEVKTEHLQAEKA